MAYHLTSVPLEVTLNTLIIFTIPLYAIGMYRFVYELSDSGTIRIDDRSPPDYQQRGRFY